LKLNNITNIFSCYEAPSGIKSRVFSRCFRDPIPVPRISNRVIRIRENYHRVLRIREIGSLQVHTGYLTISLKKTGKSMKSISRIYRKIRIFSAQYKGDPLFGCRCRDEILLPSYSGLKLT